MGRKHNEGPLVLENIEILDAGAEGNAIARYNDMVIFVPFVVPGDVCDIRIVSRKRRFFEGRAIRFHRYSPLRVEPVCAHFGLCGGCRWQNLSYTEQLRFKQKQVSDSFSRIGHLEYPEIRPIIASVSTEHYRNKLEYTFSPHRWLTQAEMNPENGSPDMNALGFHIPGMFDKILDIEQCHLQPEPTNAIRLAMKKFALENHLSFYDIRKFEGDLRNLIVRNSNTGDLMVIMVFSTDDAEIIEKVMLFLKNGFQQISSLYYVINQKHNDTIGDLEPVLYSGKAFMTENMEDLSFRIGPLSFFQTNSAQAIRLYDVARSFAGLKGDELVYDLYTGTGTIANFVARQARQVIGIEYVEAAVRDAEVNSRINGILNTSFLSGDMVKVLTPEFIETTGKPDVIITDPPRAGMHEKVVKRMLEAEPSRIVYVSCNPATQARDLAILAEKYSITAVQPVDMFPHTHHVENVCRLELK